MFNIFIILVCLSQNAYKGSELFIILKICQNLLITYIKN